MKKYRFILVLLASCIISACNSGNPTQKLSGTLSVYNWSFVVPEDVLHDFENQYHVKLVYDNFSNNEELLAKIQNPSHGYDVIFPSDYMVEIMIKQNLLQKLNFDSIPNAANIDPNFRGKFFDPKNEYSIPFQWSTAGIGINTRFVKDDRTSWDILFDQKYKGKISVLDDMRYGIAIALIKLGYSPNTTNLKELEQAKMMMQKQKPLVKAYSSDTYIDLLKSGEVWISYGYSVDILQMNREMPDIKYIIPEEGATMAIESMCIPKGSTKMETAEAFINYILDPKIHARITKYSLAGNPNAAAKKYLDDSLKNNKNLFPDSTMLTKLVFLKDVGDKTPAYEKTWNEIKNF